MSLKIEANKSGFVEVGYDKHAIELDEYVI